MGFWRADTPEDKALLDARRALDAQCDDKEETKAMRGGDESAIRRNEELQRRVIETSRQASKGARSRWG